MMNQSVCRCCLKENPQITYKIFEISSSLLQDLQELSPVTIKYEQNDGLPQIICDICWLQLQKFKEFRHKCLLADQELRNRYNEYKNEAVEEVLGLLEKFRQEDSKVGDLKFNQTFENLYENTELNLDKTDFDALEMSFLTDYMTYDQDFNNSSHDSGIFEEEFYNHKVHNFENILQNETNNDSTFVTQTSAPESLDCVTIEKKKSSKGPFNCPECDKKFTRNFQLKLHMVSIHNIGNGPQYNCQICNKTFASLHSLRYHQKSIHYQQKSHSCSECDRQFITKSQLISHMRIHTGEMKPRIFECSECGKKWPTKSDLRTHMRIHDPNVEKPFKCDLCEKRFFSRGHLNSHLLVHTGEKPYACEFCNRSYQSVGNLNNHLLRRHNKEVVNESDHVKANNIEDFNGDQIVLMEL